MCYITYPFKDFLSFPFGRATSVRTTAVVPSVVQGTPASHSRTFQYKASIESKVCAAPTEALLKCYR